MHPVRRRKKRPNYGVRTVEVNRGKNGFGFTISGQQPCILSCIVAGSPAERAGLRPGDYLVAVNGLSVSKIPHDDVVRLIGSSFGLLKLQIAENYYSDSSDEDALALNRPKPKHPLKPRSGGLNRPLSTPITATATTVENRAAKVVRDLRTGAMFVEQELEDESSIGPAPVLVRSSNKLTVLPQDWNPPVPLLPPPQRLYPNPQEEQQVENDHLEYRVLVGYLGTIEMPKELQPGSRLQIVRSCIRRLRAEKRAHTLVLMSIQTRSLILTNCHKTVLAKYPVERVTFCGSGLDDQKRFFGLITAANQETEDDTGDSVISSSCHVFAVELRLNGSHADHAAKAETFKFECTVDVATGLCLEFPASSDPIVAAIKVLYSRSREVGENPDEEPLVANSPQPSNASSTTTTASSNSDSGIGFRDDCGHQSDRILMVDVQNQRLHIQQMVNDTSDSQEIYNGAAIPPKSCKYDFGLPIVVNRSNQCIDEGCSSRLTVRAMPDPVISISGIAASSRSRSPLSSSSSEDEALKMKTRRRVYAVDQPVSDYNFENYHNGPILSNMSAKSNDDMSISSGTNKSEERSVLYPSKHTTSFTNKISTPISFLSGLQEKSDISNLHYSAFAGVRSDARSLDAMSVDSVLSQDPLLSYKLSPKVFGLSRPVVTHSLEDLKAVGVCPMRECEVTSSTVSTIRGQQWGSLQELRSFVANCFEAAPTDQHMHSDREASAEPDDSEKGVSSWSASFEKLLEDPAGLHTFAEFLKKEFSHENIYFWVACEKYRELTNEDERKLDAKAIFGRHLCLGALEPVNVDSHARQVTQDSLGEASQALFMQAQKQIFNLMKFDSYPRFIKSELYKECLLKELSGQQLPFPGEHLDAGLQLRVNKNKTELKDHKLKKSHSDAEDQRRKSLLPWHRKNRSKSKDRGESEYHKQRHKRCADDTVSIRSEMSSSRSSLASWDIALRGSFSRQSIISGESVERALCRVILPDGATTVVQTRPNEAVRDLVLRLLDKRGLNYSAFQVFTNDSIRPVSLDDESCVLGSKEVRVEQRIVFRLDLPNRKTVGVKAKPSKTLAEVLKPILHKYGYKLDLVTVCLMSENEVLELNLPVVAVDNQRLQVLTRSSEAWKSDVAQSSAPHAKLKAGPTLDEITNRVFEELLQGKADDSTKTSDQTSVKSEDWGSEHSSGIFGRFLRRDSAVHDKLRESRGKIKKGVPTKASPEEVVAAPSNKTVLITKLKPGAKLQGRPELLSPELYEGLKRAQRSRLEDQRGTEINFELPDFLKDKENAPQAGKKYRKLRKGETDPPDCDQQPVASSNENLSSMSVNKSAYRVVSMGNITSSFFDDSYSDGVLPTPRKAEEYFLGRSELLSSITCKSSVSNSDDVKSDDANANDNSMDNTLVEGSALDGTLTGKMDGFTEAVSGATCSLRPHSDPPPLPPKPKHLPVKVSVWNNPSTAANHHPTFRVPAEITNSNTRFVRPNEVKKDPRVCRGRRAVYLDQPSSSFV